MSCVSNLPKFRRDMRQLLMDERRLDRSGKPMDKDIEGNQRSMQMQMPSPHIRELLHAIKYSVYPPLFYFYFFF